MWVYVVGMYSQANDATPDKIQSKGKCLPVERSLSEEQCEYENATSVIHLPTTYAWWCNQKSEDAGIKTQAKAIALG